MKARNVYPSFLVLITVTATLLVGSQSGFSQGSYLMETGYMYSANFPTGSVFDVDGMIENAKAAGFWVRIGPRGVPGALAGNTSPEYTYYHGDEVFDCPSPNTPCAGYPILYAYPDDGAFSFSAKTERYNLQMSPKLPHSTLSPSEYVIHIVPESDIQEDYAEDEANRYLLSLGITRAQADLYLIKGTKIGDYTTTNAFGGGLGSILPPGTDPLVLTVIIIVVLVVAVALVLRRLL